MHWMVYLIIKCPTS
ncbi:unnamed protein product [Allacma fusca]|uniref:Uncharacterized protein n=1 Tax=Allacma fusca TaxID=39272 RepID=A0A8J2LJ22_9HEXA|nr:unnamed protein product [Allacma fusca]